MNNWSLIVLISFLLIFAAGWVIYPFRRQYKASFILAAIFIMSSSLAYYHWGAWQDWQEYVQNQVKQKQAKQLLAKIKSTDELIIKLRAQLDDKPASAKGWYLLGRLYASQSQWLQARDAFAKAISLNPNDETAAINYVQALWQLNDQKFNSEIRRLLKGLLNTNPGQGDALALLAMDAYQKHDFSQAIDYWQQLLKQVPENSEEAQALRKAIAKAQSQ